jgi:ATP-dependent DNA helicase RecG
MNASEILSAVNAGEDKDWEFKSAKGGLPGSMWETYGAMANTDGGVIVLGVKESDGDFEVQGLDDPAKVEKDFWSTINNRGKVSANLLANSDVRVVPVDGKPVLVVQVPRASRRQRPVFVGQNPLEGTYRRYSDGDYLCSREEVGRMLADQADQPADCEILPRFRFDDLDKRSLDQYRHRFASRSPAHPWLKLDDQGLLERLGGWRTDRASGDEGLTVAGLLMFGRDEVIRDPAAVPQYHVDYRERLSNDPHVRWTDRIWPDGTWVANLFQFFERVYPRLVADLKVPFQLVNPKEAGLFQRHDETLVHEAIREAFVNSLIHADFRGQGGVVIERYRDRLEFSNPGTLLLGIEQILRGGVSECRNKTLQSMFAMLGYGEKAGSGIDKIRQGWASQKWRWPLIEEQHRPDRVRLVLPMVSLLPEESLDRLRQALGDDLAGLDGREVQALVTADVEGSVSNQRLRQFCTDHTADITRLLQDLVAKGFLEKDGYGRWASYRLSERAAGSRHKEEGSPDITPEDSRHSEAPPVTGGQAPAIAPESDPALLAIAEPARKQKRLDPDEMRRLIRALCQGRFLTFRQLAALLNREPNGLQRWTLRPMAQEKQLVLAYPDTPNHPRQAYRTNPDWRPK